MTTKILVVKDRRKFTDRERIRYLNTRSRKQRLETVGITIMGLQTNKDIVALSDIVNSHTKTIKHLTGVIINATDRLKELLRGGRHEQ